MYRSKFYVLREKPLKTDPNFYISSPENLRNNLPSTKVNYRENVVRCKKKILHKRRSKVAPSKINKPKKIVSPRMKKYQHKNFSIVKPKESDGAGTSGGAIQSRLLNFRTFPNLTQAMLNQVISIWAKKNSSEILVNNFNILIRVKDLKTLANTNWLNNDIINFYMCLIMKRSEMKELPKVYSMNTFFYSKLKQDGYKSLKRWTKMVDIFAYDLVLVPIFSSAHWSLAVVNFQNKSIKFYDSMGLSNRRCLNLLKQYLNDECLDKKQKTFDVSNWILESVNDIPQQKNCNDCGIFVCVFAEYLTANRTFNFTQKDIDYFRKKIAYEILKSELLNFS